MNVATDAFFEVLKARLLPVRAAFKKRYTIAFAVVDGGAYVLDTHAPEMFEKTYRTGCDVSVLCNTKTLYDIADGSFDLDAPEAHHLFRWGGNPEALQALAGVLQGSKSPLAVRASQ